MKLPRPTIPVHHIYFIIEMAKLQIISILGGDFNCVTDVSLDKGGGNSDCGDIGGDKLTTLCRDFSLADAFRNKYPNKHEYTWCNLSKTIVIRLDTTGMYRRRGCLSALLLWSIDEVYGHARTGNMASGLKLGKNWDDVPKFSVILSGTRDGGPYKREDFLAGLAGIIGNVSTRVLSFGPLARNSHPKTNHTFEFLLTVRGHKPLCLRCRHEGHYRRDCFTPFCRHLGEYGHTTESCSLGPTIRPQHYPV